jgi:hypothetical protein
MDMLGLIVIGVLIVIGYTIYNSDKVVESMTGNKKKGCSDKCKKPKKLNDNCSDKIYKQKNGDCYKKCPYERTNPSDECEYDSGCMGCGFKKFKVKCNGVMEPVRENVESDREAAYDDLKDEFSSGVDSLFGNNDNSKNIKTEHHLYLHHVDDKKKCKEPYHSVKKGGILSDQYKHLIENTRGDKDKSSVYNYGEPGSPLDLKHEVANFKVDYTNRPTLTGMFTDTGPYGSNIGSYKPYNKGCNCPVSKSN